MKSKVEDKKPSILVKILSSPILWAAIYLIVNIILMNFHEVGDEEANLWLIAKNSDFSNLFNNMSGLPIAPLWLVVLMPLAHLGLPFIAARILALVLTTVAIYLLYKKAPFGLVAKVLITFSSLFLFQTSVIATNYSLIPLAVVLAALAYRKRLEHPIRYALSLVFLMQANLMCAPLVLILVIWFMFEYFKTKDSKHKKSPISYAGFIAIIAASIASIVPVIVLNIQNNYSISIIKSHDIDYIAVYNDLNNLFYNTTIPVLTIAFVVAGIITLLQNFKLFIWYLISMASAIVIMMLLYLPSLNFSVMIPLVAINVFLYWASFSEKAKGKLFSKSEIVKLLHAESTKIAGFMLVVIASIPVSLQVVISDIQEKYSISEDTTEYLSTIEDNAIIFVDQRYYGDYDSIVLTDGGAHQFYDMADKNYYTFNKNDVQRKASEKYESEEKYAEYVDQIFKEVAEEDQPIYMFSSISPCSGASSYADHDNEDKWEKVLTATDGSEKFYRSQLVLYKLKK